MNWRKYLGYHGSVEICGWVLRMELRRKFLKNERKKGNFKLKMASLRLLEWFFPRFLLVIEFFYQF